MLQLNGEKKIYAYDAEHERKRKEQLKKLYERTPEQVIIRLINNGKLLFWNQRLKFYLADWRRTVSLKWTEKNRGEKERERKKNSRFAKTYKSSR